MTRYSHRSYVAARCTLRPLGAPQPGDWRTPQGALDRVTQQKHQRSVPALRLFEVANILMLLLWFLMDHKKKRLNKKSEESATARSGYSNQQDFSLQIK